MTDKQTESSDNSCTQGNSPDILETSKAILKENRAIKAELKALNSHKLIRIYNSIPRLLYFSLLKGIALGLGSVLGATIVVSILVSLLSQIELIPIIGEWIKHIITAIQATPSA